ncbi:cytochrome P450 [Pectobacterium carotovorum]|uniref:Cytochrome P450 n=1 Tax=Pectobacterium carotovorum TaxID=554 RepID=A0A419ARF7_PECCA|nr:cytochrome P450 [Pectobacterium carotovorum]RJL47372.1 cytochrome P450 [Pectobacterium carotovorum]
MNFKSDLLKNRYASYEQYRGRSPFFDPDLNSHIFLNYEEVSYLLKSSELSSNRKKNQFDQLRQCPFSKNIVEFYDQWLMYMDGEDHKEARKLISSSLSKSTQKIEEIVKSAFSLYIEDTLLTHNNLDIAKHITTPFVINILSTLLGIEHNSYNKIIDTSKPIVMFLGNGDVGNENDRKKVLKCLKETQTLLMQSILDCKNSESVIGHLLRQGIEIEAISPLLINVVIDGYDPLSSIINNYFYIISKKTKVPTDITPNELFDEIVRLEPPFQYCARVATEDIYIGSYEIKKNERVMSFISAANRDPVFFKSANKIRPREKEFKHLSFGAGKHLCSGANLSKRIAVIFFIMMNDLNRRISLHHIEDKWINTVGYRTLENLVVNIEKRSIKNV